VTKDQIIAALKSLVPQAERDGMDTANNAPVYGAVAGGLAKQSARRVRTSEAKFLLPHSLQKGPPAGFARRARFAVTVYRGGNMDLALRIDPGRMIMQGPGGRLYVNQDVIEYARRDDEPVREAVFNCIVPGECGNLEFLINDELNQPKGKPAGWISAEYVDLVDQSRGRSNRGASVILAEGTIAIKDSGIPTVFEAGDAGLYAEILYSTDMDNVGRMWRIRDHRWPGVEEPANSNIRPTIALLDDDHVREEFAAGLQDDGGVFTDYTVQLNEPADELDVPLLPAAPADGDAFYFAAAAAINELQLRLDQPGAGDYKLAWEVWDGGAWVIPPDVLDGTSGFKVSGLVHVGGLGVQNPTTVNGIGPYYWVRARVFDFIALTTQPIAGYGYPLCYESMHVEAGTIEWAVRDWKDLGFKITSLRQITLGREPDLEMLGDNRGLYPEKKESEEAFRRRIATLPDVITPAALNRTVNRILAPLKLKSHVIDIGDEVHGFFFDQDAYDYYEPGYLFPENPWKLLLDITEAYGFFYVLVPWVAEGDYGIFYDEGPSIYLPDKGLFLGPCWDDGFLDGESPVAKYDIYPTIFREMTLRKLGGVQFAMIPDIGLNVPP
jgi:hypothetical protein